MADDGNEAEKKIESDNARLYINTLLAFKGLPNTMSPLLSEFLSFVTYKDKKEGQKIYVNIDMKREIAEKLKRTVDSVNKGLFRLTKNGILERVGNGTYQANPQMFGSGRWKDVTSIKATFDFDTGKVTADIQTEKGEESNE